MERRRGLNVVAMDAYCSQNNWLIRAPKLVYTQSGGGAVGETGDGGRDRAQSLEHAQFRETQNLKWSAFL